MSEVDPGHPVERFRFVTRRSPASPVAPQEEDARPSASNMSGRDARIEPAELEAARRVAESVGDERLRQTIEAALGAASAQPPQGPPGGPAVNPKK